MTFIKNLPIKYKIFVAIASVNFAISIFMLAYFPRSLTEQTMQGLVNESMALASMMAFSVAGGLEFDDEKTALEVFRYAHFNKNLQYAVIFKPDGSIFSGANSELAKTIHFNHNQSSGIHFFQQGLLNVSEPIMVNNKKIGTLVIGVSLALVEQAEFNHYISILGISVVIFILGLIFALKIGAIISRPLQKITEVSEEIASGHLNHHSIVVTANDEVGRLTRAFNAMVSANLNRDSELNRLLQELKDSQLKIVQSAKLASLGEMSSGVAHELNNPLTLVVGFGEQIAKTLQKKYPEVYTELKENLDFILHGATRMRAIIDHLREFSRQSTNRFEPLDLIEIIDNSFIMFNEQFRLRNITIKKNFPQEKILVNGDKIKLEQVLVNLLSNSRDAVAQKAEKGGSIALKVEAKAGAVCVYVEDNGCGMSNETKEKLFDAFYTTKIVGKGTGLGLSVTLGIIQEHQGSIEVESTEGQGTVMCVTLPRL